MNNKSGKLHPEKKLKMETVKLNNGIEMPVLRFGFMQMMGDECEAAVINAIEAG